MVFQSYALFPHMKVCAATSASDRASAATPRDDRRQGRQGGRALNLSDYLDRFPRQLSGGQRQRVAMGRTIVREPDLFLFDEPLSNLDAKLRVQMRTEIKALHQALKTTIVYVTHDQIEAMTMADRIVVMNAGADRTGRRAARALRPSRESLRRQLPRLAFDEFHRRRGRARRGGPALRAGGWRFSPCRRHQAASGYRCVEIGILARALIEVVLDDNQGFPFIVEVVEADGR